MVWTLEEKVADLEKRVEAAESRLDRIERSHNRLRKLLQRILVELKLDHIIKVIF